MEHEILVIVEVQAVLDEAAFQAYRAQAREQLIARGGKLLARGGALFEGDPELGSILIQQWPSEVAFREWQKSSEYAPLRKIRQAAAKMRISLIPAVV